MNDSLKDAQSSKSTHNPETTSQGFSTIIPTKININGITGTGNIPVDASHEIDKSSGFLQSSGPYLDAFDANSKHRFLEYYKANGLRLNSTCKAIKVKRDTVKKHMDIDPTFRAAVREIEDDWLEELESVSKVTALNPKSTIERIFQLKCHLPDRYGQFEKATNQPITINLNGNLLVDAKRRAEMIDAEIVREVEQESARMVSDSMCNSTANDNVP